MIRTLVCAPSTLGRESLGAIVRGDARLDLVAEAAPEDLARTLLAFETDVLVERRPDGDERDDAPARLPTVALVDDPASAWRRERTRDEREPHAILGGDASPQEVVAAIVAVAAGLVAVQPRALATAGYRAAFEPAGNDGERLTAREIDVLGELARGVPNKTIAGRLGISEHTVKFHIASIFAKLGASSRTEAVTRGVRLGLIML